MARTPDGKITVSVYEDQTADIRGPTGALLAGPALLYKIGKKLAEMGIDPDDLVVS